MKNRLPTWFKLILAAGGALVAFVLGLWAFAGITATPLHPDPNGVPSVWRSAPSPQWTNAVKQAQQIARASLLEQNLPGLSAAVGVGGKLLQPDTVKMLQTSQRLASGEETGSGLGWKFETIPLAGEQATLARQDDRRSVGGSTTFITFPDRQLAVAVTSNITFADTSSVALKIAQAFAEQGKNPARK